MCYFSIRISRISRNFEFRTLNAGAFASTRCPPQPFQIPSIHAAYAHALCVEGAERGDDRGRGARGWSLFRGVRHDVKAIRRIVKLNFSRRPTFNNQSALLYGRCYLRYTLYTRAYTVQRRSPSFPSSFSPSVTSPPLSHSLSIYLSLEPYLSPPLYLSVFLPLIVVGTPLASHCLGACEG